MRNKYLLILILLLFASTSFARRTHRRNRVSDAVVEAVPAPTQYFEITLPALEKIVGQAEVMPAWVEPTFGPEFTFSKENFIRDSTQICDRCRTHLVDEQPFGAQFKVVDNHFISPNGWGFTVSTDMGVIEVKMDPMFVEGYKRNKTDIQDAIFASAGNVGLYPFLFQGGGHISIGWDTFKDNILLLRNFMVDMYNHNELTMGVFNFDTRNAFPIQMGDGEVLARFRGFIESIDSGELSDMDAIRRYLGEVRIRHDAFVLHDTIPKAVALNSWRLNELPNERRLELRAVRPQASADVFVRQISLLRDRIHYLYRFNKPLDLKLEVKIKPMPGNIEEHRFEPPIEPQEAMRAFYKYVREAGQRWSDHRDYLWPNWISSGELTKFEASEWFKHAEADRCVELLQSH